VFINHETALAIELDVAQHHPNEFIRRSPQRFGSRHPHGLVGVARISLSQGLRSIDVRAFDLSAKAPNLRPRCPSCESSALRAR